MSNVTVIHKSKQPRRPHYIVEWTERRGLSQAELARELNADPGLVSRWFKGASPGVDWQQRLAAFFGIEPEELFSSPDENWLKRFFAGRSRDEIEHIKKSLEVTFPLKRVGGGAGLDKKS